MVGLMEGTAHSWIDQGGILHASGVQMIKLILLISKLVRSLINIKILRMRLNLVVCLILSYFFGHSMGGFVARAAVVHPNLRKSVVETGITLSTPHQSPPAAIIGSLLRVHRLAMEKG
ncbi:GPI inositol-deacylase isoform X1 [Tanacetum coccineum]|uniref:GPI inositol-deacylase n=1 Tax=Tanacetum coccineum TaxID=301880 RepID=A0ABQ5D9F2_9ASTR